MAELPNIPDAAPPPLITSAEVLRRLSISRRHLQTLVAEGLLQAIRIGRRGVRFDPRDVDRFIAERKGGRR